MATKTKGPLHKRRPEPLRQRSIKDVSEEFKGSLHAIDRTKVSIHSAGDGSGSEMDGELGGVITPTTEQVAKINEFSKRTMTADDVVAFTANAMNDLFDRDDEAFKKSTVDQFATLPQPFSFVGKSYMADHGRSIKDIRGRIFDVSTKTIKGVHFLRPDIYIPKRPQHEEFIQNVEDGLNWAVSVGVVIDKSSCTICGEPVYTSSWSGWSWCESGHEKGFFYVPGKEEDDGWGFFLPVDPGTKGAVKAQVWLEDAVDAYELSQVFLGSQLFAQIADKRPSIKRALDRAAKKSISVVGLSQKEAEDITMPREPKEVALARKSYRVTEDDGVIKWVDAKGIAWVWDSNESTGVLCLGAVDELDDEDPLKVAHAEAAADDEDSEDEDDEEEDSEDEEEDEDEDEEDDPAKAAPPASDPPAAKAVLTTSLGKRLAALKQDAATVDNPEDTAEVAQAIDGLIDALDVLADDLLENLGLSEEEEDGSVAAAPGAGAVLKAAVSHKLPQTIVEALADADDTDALNTVFAEVSKSFRKKDKEIKNLLPRAKSGDQYLIDLEKNALHWFTVSRRDPKNPTKGVNVELAQKLIKQAGGDIDTLKALADDWKHEAEGKYPSPVRRSSSAVEDPNKPEGLPELKLSEPNSIPEQDRTVRNLHG